MTSAHNNLKKLHGYYETRLREDLEKEHFGKWAVVSEDGLVGIYDYNSQASEIALKLEPNQVCLVKHIGYIVATTGSTVGIAHVPIRRP